MYKKGSLILSKKDFKKKKKKDCGRYQDSSSEENILKYHYARE